jgi:hypothetical protein
MADEPLFPAFVDAMEKNLAASRELPRMTLFRYAKGELPASFAWFLQHPDMLEALARDARKLTPKQLKQYREGIEKRGQVQKKYREKKKAGDGDA